MELIQKLKAEISTFEEQNLGLMLNESTQGISNAMENSLWSFFNGLKNIAISEGSAASIFKVIQDGGHSGELVADLKALLHNNDKVQLLMTIGKNISGHFFGVKTDEMAKGIASGSGVKVQSALSLLSLAAPLVLGSIGKKIKSENLSVEELTHFLTGKPAIIPDQIHSSASDTASHQNTPKKTKKKSENNSNYNGLAWVLLGLLGAAVLYYSLKETENSNIDDASASAIDSSQYEKPADIFEELNTDRNRNLPSSSGQLPNINTPNVEAPIKALPKSTSPQTSIAENRSKLDESVKGTSKETANDNNLTDPVSANKNKSNKDVAITTDNRPMSAKLGETLGSFGINGLSFKSNSAEITNEGALNEVVNYLKTNPISKIQIAGGGNSGRLAEDRAYALRDLLYAKGVNLERISISAKRAEEQPVTIKVW